MFFDQLDPYFLSALTLLVLASIVSLHFLLFREYFKQDHLQSKRLQDLEKLVALELIRSKNMDIQNKQLERIKSRTQAQLDLIQLQVEAMKTHENPQPKKPN